MTDIFSFTDELGPAKVLHVYEPTTGLKGIMVIDNIAKGPSIGGIRIAPDVTLEECLRLARAMTMKNAAAGLPHGGGKAVVQADPKMPKPQKQQLIRALAQALSNMKGYILAPDMGTDEECMAWIKDEVDRVVGLPREVGGIPLDEIGATGWGLSNVVEVALQHCDFELDGATLAIQGFGAVGKHAARFFTEKGAVLVAASDTSGTIHNADGLDVDALIQLKERGGCLAEYNKATLMEIDAIVDVECDIWVPAARPDVINEGNVDRLKTKLVIEGANIPITPGAEKKLHERGILCVPDFIANAGGVICAAMEYRGSSEKAVFDTIAEKLRRNTALVLEEARDSQILPREAAMNLALRRVKKAMGFRRWTIF